MSLRILYHARIAPSQIHTCVLLWLQKLTHSFCMISAAYVQENLHQGLVRCQVTILHLPPLKRHKSLHRVSFLGFNIIDIGLLQPQVGGNPAPVQEEGDAGEVLIRTALVKQGWGDANLFHYTIQCGKL